MHSQVGLLQIIKCILAFYSRHSRVFQSCILGLTFSSPVFSVASQTKLNVRIRFMSARVWLKQKSGEWKQFIKWTLWNIQGRINKCGGSVRKKIVGPIHSIKMNQTHWKKTKKFYHVCTWETCVYFRLVCSEMFSLVLLIRNLDLINFCTRVGPLKCGGPCSAEYVRTFLNPALEISQAPRFTRKNRATFNQDQWKTKFFVRAQRIRSHKSSTQLHSTLASPNGPSRYVQCGIQILPVCLRHGRPQVIL